jgi:DinB superfamily
MFFRADEREERIAQYERGPLVIRDALALVPDAAVRWRPGKGRWSVHEIVCHCADSETNGAARIRYLVAQKDPVIVGYDQDEWARVFNYHALPLEPALHTIEAVRAGTALLLRTLPEDAWRKEGRHSDSGKYSAQDWLRIYSDHLEKHARQIERNLAAWKEP